MVVCACNLAEDSGAQGCPELSKTQAEERKSAVNHFAIAVITQHKPLEGEERWLMVSEVSGHSCPV